MRKLAILPIVIVFIFFAAKAAAQDDFKPGPYEKLLKKGALVGVKSTYKHSKEQIPPAYDSLKATRYHVFAYKNARIDVYERTFFFPLYLSSVSPQDIPMIVSFSNLSHERGAKLVYQNGLWGWTTNRYNYKVAAQYDSLKPLNNYNYYKVYKGGKIALVGPDDKVLVPFSDYDIMDEHFVNEYQIYTIDKNTGMRLLGLYRDSVRRILPRYKQISLKGFSKPVSYKNVDHYGWFVATTPDGKVDYYYTKNLMLYTPEDVSSIIAIDIKNNEEGEAHKKQMAINEQRKKEVYAGLRVFRNEQGNVGILDASGKVIVPPGLKAIFLGWNDQGSIEWEWKAAPGKHGLLFPSGYLRDDFTRHDNDTMPLFRDRVKLTDPRLQFHFVTNQSKKPDLSLAPEGGFKDFSTFDDCSKCSYGKIPAISYQVKEDYTIAPAKTTTRTEKIVSQDLDKNGKFPTRTTTTHTPAVTGTRSRTVYEPEKTCDKCDGKGSIAEIIEWNDQLQRFDRKVFGAISNPLLKSK